MKRLISTQIRFLIGTIVMWIIATIIFQNNLVVYGIEHIIRMSTYVQGAFLIIVWVAYPGEAIKAIRTLVEMFYTGIMSVGKVQIFLEPLEAIGRMELLRLRVRSTNQRWNWCKNHLKDAIDVISDIMRMKPETVQEVSPPPVTEDDVVSELQKNRTEKIWTKFLNNHPDIDEATAREESTRLLEEEYQDVGGVLETTAYTSEA